MNTKNKRQNLGSHLKNIHGSTFRKAWISNWLDQPGNKGKHYKDAVNAYNGLKSEIAKRWIAPVETLLVSEEPYGEYENYHDLLDVSKKNVKIVLTALTATDNQKITYQELVDDDWDDAETSGWMKEGDKYYAELTKPSGQTAKWMNKLISLCNEFEKITEENHIVDGLDKIIKHCQYEEGDPAKNDQLPLYKYPIVQRKYKAIAGKLITYAEFVQKEMENNYPNRKKTKKDKKVDE